MRTNRDIRTSVVRNATLCGMADHLAGVWGSSTSAAFAVGSGGTGAILHYDGIAWNPMSTGITANLEGVWGSSASDVFAVGGGGAVLH